MNQHDVFEVSRNYVSVICLKVICFFQRHLPKTVKKIIHTLVTYLVRTYTFSVHYRQYNLTSAGCAELHNKSYSFAHT